MATYDELVMSARQTSEACPTQWEGELVAGDKFYFRYRHGVASLGFGETIKAAIDNSWSNEQEIGDDLDGFLDDDGYQEMFMKLYEQYEK